MYCTSRRRAVVRGLVFLPGKIFQYLYLPVLVLGRLFTPSQRILMWGSPGTLARVLRPLVLGDLRASTHHHRLVCMHVPRRPIRRPPGDARRSTCGPAVPPERDCLCRTLSTNSSTQPYPYPTVLGRVPVPTRSWPSQQQRRRQFYRGRQEEMPFYRGHQEERRLVQGACAA